MFHPAICVGRDFTGENHSPIKFETFKAFHRQPYTVFLLQFSCMGESMLDIHYIATCTVCYILQLALHQKVLLQSHRDSARSCIAPIETCRS